MAKRVLFIMSDTGGGHRAAAEAISAALKELHGDQVEIELVDAFRGYSPFPFKYMPEFYPWLINKSKSSWGLGYKLSDSRANARTLTRGMYVTMESGLKQMLRDHPADVVVSVHSVLTRVTMQALTSLRERPPYVVVVTDLVSTHMFWYERRAERTLVPTRPAYERGLLAGLKPEQMRITGLPVHPRFARGLLAKDQARASLGWDPDLPAILIVGGGEGMGPIYKTAQAIDSLNLNCQLAIIAGRNKGLKERIESTQWHQPTHVYGFVTDMPRMMAAADILVTKAGPSTISEACIAGLPMILYDAIPGQETGNVEYVIENQAGVYAPDPREVADAVSQWLAEGPQGLQRRSQNALRIARPNAVFEIAAEVWEYAQHPRIPNERRKLLRQLTERAANLADLNYTLKRRQSPFRSKTNL
ncbi:MAG: MGDG synthase family glycosyltransferase [Candidatus Flexifilum sp.]